MSNKSYLENPPFYNKLFSDENNQEISVNWEFFFTTIVEDTGQCIQGVSFFDPVTGQRDFLPVLTATSYTAADRNLLQDVPDGTIIYNLTTNTFNFRQNGTWVTFAPIPA